MENTIKAGALIDTRQPNQSGLGWQSSALDGLGSRHVTSFCLTSAGPYLCIMVFSKSFPMARVSRLYMVVWFASPTWCWFVFNIEKG